MSDLLDDRHVQSTISNLLIGTTNHLSRFLENALPLISDDWWKDAVVNVLSFQQKQRIEQRGTSSLADLDLAALLRILDQNWFEIANKRNLTSDGRHFVKEMQTIRNRWAHLSPGGIPIDDIYRDLDTLQRFSALIGADEKLLQELKVLKKSLISKESDHPPHLETSSITVPNHENRSLEFEMGQIVCVKANPANRGAVIQILPGKPENRFKVFILGETQTYYESQLQSVDIQDDHTEFLTSEQFHAYLTALQIRFPGLSTLYSLNAARVDFIPYQFRPVLRFIRSDRPRLLIADSVGVGKTIEAGLILRELQARRNIRSVLIICPRPLVTERKWEGEMKRFEERFIHLDGKGLRYCINEMGLDGEWPEQYQKIIVPYSLFDEVLLHGSEPKNGMKRKKGLLDLEPSPRFDLVIVDEAHHIRNPGTFSHKAVRFFCDHAEAVLFLTATPIQMGNYDLFVLLNVLRPDLIIDQKSFEHLAEPNPFINQAAFHLRTQSPECSVQSRNALDQAAETAWGKAILSHNPDFNRIRAMLAKGKISDEERVKAIQEIETLHTFSSIINRTRRRDIGDFTIRKPETVIVPFTPAQQILHDELLRVQAEIFNKIHGDVNIKFMMTTIRRQAASCLYGLAPFLEDILKRHLDEMAWEEADNTESVPGADVVNPIQNQIQGILDSVRTLDSRDPKLEALRSIVQDKQQLSNNKVMLFSSFRHTLTYLFKHLSEEGFRVGLVHGQTPDEDRVALRRRFEKPKEDMSSLDLLLFSEIGCEGLDYQFCDCIVNYDLPWNPMRVEQRIGRIDRNGQKSESIAIVNLITPGTVDADIYERCLVRIGVFNSALGGSEEILGEITKEIKNIAENYSLTEEQRREKLQQLSDNKIRLIQEQDALEQKQMELFGIQLPDVQIKKEIKDASSFWLSAESIRRLITLYLQKICGKDQEIILGEKSLKTLRLSQEARTNLLTDFQKLPRQNNTNYRDWENWLKGGNPHLTITFDSACAIEHQEAAFIMPLHPLVKQASMSFDTARQVMTTLKTYDSHIPEGRYRFVIYQWKFHGIREDLILQPITSSAMLTSHLVRLLEQAFDTTNELAEERDDSEWNVLEEEHYKLWSDARLKHRKRTQELADYRRESLLTSHRARIALLEEQLNLANNEKIQKMRQSQIAAAMGDFARRNQELEIAIERADIIADPVAYGIIKVESMNTTET